MTNETKEDRPVDSLMQGPLELTFGKRNLCHVETGEGHPSGQGITLFSVPRKYQAIAEAMVTAYNAIRAVPLRDHNGFEIPEHSAKGGMVRYIQRVAGLSEGAALAVLRYYEDQRIIRRRNGNGRDTAYGVDHGAFLDAEVLRRAADLAGTLYAG